MLKEKPDFVFSGINNGYNAGFDIAYSGTLGAAFEGVRNGIPAMAFSTSSNAHLDAVEPYLLPVIRELLEDREKYETMRKNLLHIAVPDCAERICTIMEELISGKGQK